MANKLMVDSSLSDEEKQELIRRRLAEDQPIEEPYIDPIALAATAATGGMSAVPAAMADAAKKQAVKALTNPYTDRLVQAAKQAGQVRRDVGADINIPEVAQSANALNRAADLQNRWNRTMELARRGRR